MKGTVKSDTADIILNSNIITVQKRTVIYARENISRANTQQEAIRSPVEIKQEQGDVSDNS